MQLTQQFKGLDPKPVPPEGSKIIGQHTDGRPIYQHTERVVVGKKPRVINGQDIWRKAPNGEPINQVFDRKWGERSRVFVLEPCKNGNVIINVNFRQSPEDAARELERQQVAEFKDRLALAAIRRGITPEQLVESLAGALPAQEEGYPVDIGDGVWELSNGEPFAGTALEAAAAEADVKAAAA